MIFRLAILFVCLLLRINLFAESAFLPEANRIFVHVEHTDADSKSARKTFIKRGKPKEIPFVVRMPISWTPEKQEKAKKTGVPAVGGVLAICTWHKEIYKLKENLSSEKSPHKYLIKFADENNLALITWANFGGYQKALSSDEMSKKQAENSENIFSDRLMEWESGLRRIAKRYELPKDSMLIYGISGGAQIAHRIVLRKPQYFSGIHMHVNSSYDIPNSKAKNVVWLVTTGELEYGYTAAKRFYQRMIDLEYCVIFKAGENLGHDSNSQIDNLSMEFFKYMIKFTPDYSNPEWKAPPIDKFYLIKHPIYVGDYLNQVAYPIENAVKNVSARKYMVALPTKQIAKAWGKIIEK